MLILSEILLHLINLELLQMTRYRHYKAFLYLFVSPIFQRKIQSDSWVCAVCVCRAVTYYIFGWAAMTVLQQLVVGVF